MGMETVRLKARPFSCGSMAGFAWRSSVWLLETHIGQPRTDMGLTHSLTSVLQRHTQPFLSTPF